MPDPVRVLVLYSHPLMGQGLERMLAAEFGVPVEVVDGACAEAVATALDRSPQVVVLEEGGDVDAAEVVRRSGCELLLDVDITTTCGFALRRETLAAGPDAFLATIRRTVRTHADPSARPGDERAAEAPEAPDERGDRDDTLRLAAVPR